MDVIAENFRDLRDEKSPDDDEKGPIEDEKLPDVRPLDEESEDEKAPVSEFAEYLVSLNSLIGSIPPDEIKQYIEENMSEEADSLVNSFLEAFDGVPRDDPTMIECLKIMGRLGIDVCEMPDDKKEEVIEADPADDV